MVSPLQTWQHREPKYLWWLLGGLSVMAHVGILGLSLTYVLELMASDAVRSPITVPIDLIAIDPIEEDIEEPTTANAPSTATASPPAPSTAIPPRAISTTEPIAPIETRNTQRDTTNSRAVNDKPAQREAQTPDVSAATSPSGPLSSPANQTQPLPSETIESSDAQPINPPSEVALPDQAPSDSAPSDSAPSDSALSDPVPSPQESAGDESADAGDQRVTDNLIRRPGEVNPIFSANGIIEPDDVTASDRPETETPEAEPAESDNLDGETLRSVGEGDRAQAVSFRVVGIRIAPVQDLPAEPPQLIGNSSTIELQPSSLGCGVIDFSQPQRTYRLAIDASGNLSTITLWADGRGEPLSESAPMACLIRSAGLTFQPAKAVDGTPTLDDSLLLTVEVLELQRPSPNADGP